MIRSIIFVSLTLGAMLLFISGALSANSLIMVAGFCATPLLLFLTGFSFGRLSRRLTIALVDGQVIGMNPIPKAGGEPDIDRLEERVYQRLREKRRRGEPS